MDLNLNSRKLSNKEIRQIKYRLKRRDGGRDGKETYGSKKKSRPIRVYKVLNESLYQDNILDERNPEYMIHYRETQLRKSFYTILKIFAEDEKTNVRRQLCRMTPMIINDIASHDSVNEIKEAFVDEILAL